MGAFTGYAGHWRKKTARGLAVFSGSVGFISAECSPPTARMIWPVKVGKAVAASGAVHTGQSNSMKSPVGQLAREFLLQPGGYIRHTLVIEEAGVQAGHRWFRVLDVGDGVGQVPPGFEGTQLVPGDEVAVRAVAVAADL